MCRFRSLSGFTRFAKRLSFLAPMNIFTGLLFKVTLALHGIELSEEILKKNYPENALRVLADYGN